MKRCFYVILCFLVIITGQIFAEEFTTLDGEHYTGATLKRIEPDGLVIAYSDGVKKLKFQRLPIEIQKKYKYNAADEKNFLEKSNAEAVGRHAEAVGYSQKSQPSASPATDGSFVATVLRNKLLDEKIRVANFNCDFVKKRIASLEQSLAEGPGGLFYIKEELEKKKLELPIKEAILARLLAERNPTPTPTLPPPSFLEKYGQYLLWSLLGIAGIILFLWRKS